MSKIKLTGTDKLKKKVNVMRKKLLLIIVLLHLFTILGALGANTTNTFKLEYQFRDEGDHWFPLYFTINDVNGDGKKDIIASEIYRRSDITQKWRLNVLLQTKDYCFYSNYSYVFDFVATIKNPFVCDMNNDGKQDIILLKENLSLDENMLCIFYQDSSSFHLQSYPYSGEKVYVTDMNGDTKPDILILSQKYFNKTRFGIIKILYFNSKQVIEIDEFTIEIPFYRDHYTNRIPYFFYDFLVEDLNNDNLADIISLESINDYYGSFSVLLNMGKHNGFKVDTTINLNDTWEVSSLDIYRKQGSNNFTLAVSYSVPGSFAVFTIDSLQRIYKQYYFHDETRMYWGIEKIFCEDFDSNGWPEIICQYDSMYLFRGNQTALWYLAESFGTGDPIEEQLITLVDDIDNDGDLDFIMVKIWDKHYYFFINQTVQSTQVNSSTYLPSTFQLSQNYPNPFNTTTFIPFEVNSFGEVSLSILDITGRQTALVLNRKFYSPGRYSIPFNALSLPTGLYFYQIETQGQTGIKKMLLIR